MAHRTEEDSMGSIKVPRDAYYGAFTQRALDNFQISGIRADPYFIDALVTIKAASAATNAELKILDKTRAKAIQAVCKEILTGHHREEFMLDVFQAGAGTPFNMNANEVIANRANELLGGKLGKYKYVHPNDHVNLCQSTNDVVPAAIRLAALFMLKDFEKSCVKLQKALESKAKQFSKIPKGGRTHLQDAVPLMLGQDFGAYAQAVKKSVVRIKNAEKCLMEIGLGGTALGTGINSHPKFGTTVVKRLKKMTRLSLKPAKNKFEHAQFSTDFYEASSALTELAIDLSKICNDLRLLTSGPFTGLNEIDLPEVEPGSSIMPGKINPSICEAVNMVCYQVMGNNHTIELAAQAGQLELNVMTPLIMHNLLQSIGILDNGVQMLTDKCIKGIRANREACEYYFTHSLGAGTALATVLGYTKAAAIVKEAVRKRKTVEVILKERKLFSAKVKSVLKTENLTKPNLRG